MEYWGEVLGEAQTDRPERAQDSSGSDCGSVSEKFLVRGV